MEWINLRKLQYFYYVAQLGSYTEAARILQVQQPALSKMVHSLEESMGMKLFKKLGRGVELTTNGQFVFEQCQKSFSHVQKIQEFSRHRELLVQESFKVSFADSIISLFPTIIESIKIEFPQLRLILIQELAQASIQKIARGDLDLALLFHASSHKNEIVVKKRWPTQFMVVGHKNILTNLDRAHQFIGSREIESPENNRFPVVEFLKLRWPKLQIHYTSNSLEMHLAMVKSGLGISLLPSFMVAEELKTGSLIKIVDQIFVFDLKLIVSRQNGEKHWKQAVVDIVINKIDQIYHTIPTLQDNSQTP